MSASPLTDSNPTRTFLLPTLITVRFMPLKPRPLSFALIRTRSFVFSFRMSIFPMPVLSRVKILAEWLCRTSPQNAVIFCIASRFYRKTR